VDHLFQVAVEDQEMVVMLVEMDDETLVVEEQGCLVGEDEKDLVVVEALKEKNQMKKDEKRHLLAFSA
jgi:urease accessory protein UreE